MKENKNKIGLAILLIAIVLFAGGITFAFFKVGVTEEKEKLTVTTGTLTLTFADNNTGITASEIALGDSTTKEFTIKNTGSLPTKTNMLWNNLINTYLKESMSYTLQRKTSAESEWEATPLASGNIPRSAIPQDFTLAENITIPVGATYYYKLTITFNNLSDVDQTIDISAKLASSFKLGDAITLSDADKTRVVLGKKVNSGTPNFASVATEDETENGLYSMADDYGASYYYRGAVTDNYVKFGKWAEGTDNAGKDMYWRIIRINGDGSIRMIYDGTSAHANGEDNTDRFTHIDKAFNTNYDDNAYVGWMYGQTGQSGEGAYDRTHTNTNNSSIKDLVDTWYKTNILDKNLDNYVSDSVYCNDRSLVSGTGEGNTYASYGAYGRLVPNKMPQLSCPNKNDAFTVDDTIKGNSALKYKVGLITADEIAVAGGVYETTNKNYYLYKSSNYWCWSLSPSYYNGTNDGHANVFGVTKHSNLNHNGYVDYSYGAVAPVISLKAEYATQLIGNGTAESPFQIPGVA